MINPWILSALLGIAPTEMLFLAISEPKCPKTHFRNQLTQSHEIPKSADAGLTGLPSGDPPGLKMPGDPPGIWRFVRLPVSSAAGPGSHWWRHWWLNWRDITQNPENSAMALPRKMVGCSGWIMGNSMDKFIGPNPAMSAELMGRIGVTIPKWPIIFSFNYFRRVLLRLL